MSVEHGGPVEEYKGLEEGDVMVEAAASPYDAYPSCGHLRFSVTLPELLFY